MDCGVARHAAPGESYFVWHERACGQRVRDVCKYCAKWEARKCQLVAHIRRTGASWLRKRPEVYRCRSTARGLCRTRSRTPTPRCKQKGSLQSKKHLVRARPFAAMNVTHAVADCSQAGTSPPGHCMLQLREQRCLLCAPQRVARNALTLMCCML